VKGFIKNILKKYVLSHQIKSLTIDESKIEITYEKMKPFFFKRYLVIKSRETGRRIQVPIANSKASVEVEDIFDLSDGGKFDFYLKFQLYKYRFLKRTPFNNKIKIKDFVDEENNRKLAIYKTINSKLSLIGRTMPFDYYLNDIKMVGTNIFLQGTIHFFEKPAPSRCKVEIILQRRDTKECFGYLCRCVKSEQTDKHHFNCVLFLDKIKGSMQINSRWDFIIQVRNKFNTVIGRELLNVRGFRELKREEDRYFIQQVDIHNNVISLYATMGKNSLALWYTDKQQFHKTYTIARGKTVFNEVCEKEKLNDKMVFFESFLGKNYSGNPKYIYEQMLRDKKFRDFTFVWSYSGENPDIIPGNPIIVNRDTMDYYKYLARAKYWVSNIVFPVHRKRDGNVYLQTWHGTPLKKLGFDIEITGPETLARENFYIESRNWDYLISANRYSTNIFKRAFKFSKKVLEVGYPVNDIFYREDKEEIIYKLKRKLNIPLDKKVILYAPTWRDNKMINSWEHAFELKFSIREFYENLKDEYVLILKLHHLVSDALQIDQRYSSFVRNLSKYDDIQELYMIADLLITDYSSVFFDFANTRKPILFFVYDYEQYRDEIRGFYLNMESDLPGPLVKTDKELLHAIENIDKISRRYENKYNDFYNKYCYLDDGEAAKRVIERVFH
jgi:CDP-glycerol glycerophosphotransferase (TagB/SpsB family)